MSMVSTADWQLAISCAWDFATMAALCAWIFSLCCLATATFASRSLFACCASQVPTLRPAMVMFMSPCFEVILTVPLYSVCAAL